MTFKTAILGIFAVMIVHAFALVTHLYFFVPDFDIPMHFGGGFVMGILGLAIFGYLHNGLPKKHHPEWYKYLFVTSFVILIAVFWEFHEYLLDQTIVSWMGWSVTQPSLADTMLDLFLGTVGGLCAACLFRNK